MPTSNQGVFNIVWRLRAIAVLPDEDTPFRTMTWVLTRGKVTPRQNPGQRDTRASNVTATRERADGPHIHRISSGWTQREG